MTIRTSIRSQLAFARRLLHAIAQAGGPPLEHKIQPLLGPNGAPMWTSGIQVDRRQPTPEKTTPGPKRSAEVPVRPRRREIRRRARAVAAYARSIRE
jgi:hypothetical protein